MTVTYLMDQREDSCPGPDRVGTACSFITLLRTVHDVKLMSCLFLEFFSKYFQTEVHYKSLKLKMKPQIRGTPIFSTPCHVTNSLQ
jgi:hypothetical protein